MYYKDTARKEFPELTNFLLCYLHEDIKSVDDSILEYIEIEVPSIKKGIINEINIFVDSDLYTIEEKKKFIQDNSRWILEPDPLTWLQDVAKKLEDSLQ